MRLLDRNRGAVVLVAMVLVVDMDVLVRDRLVHVAMAVILGGEERNPRAHQGGGGDLA